MAPRPRILYQESPKSDDKCIACTSTRTVKRLDSWFPSEGSSRQAGKFMVPLNGEARVSAYLKNKFIKVSSKTLKVGKKDFLESFSLNSTSASSNGRAGGLFFRVVGV